MRAPPQLIFAPMQQWSLVIRSSLKWRLKLSSTIYNLRDKSKRKCAEPPMSRPQAPKPDASAPDTGPRRAAMALLAQASTPEIAQGLAAVADPLRYVELRPVATGLVMVRGRVGGGGGPFHSGGAAVPGAAVALGSGGG